MKEELTTEMHSEFLGDEVPGLDLKVMGVFGAIHRGLTKSEALNKYGISEKTYDNNINRVLSEP